MKEHHLPVSDYFAAEPHSSLELVAEQCSGRDEAEQEAVVAGQVQWNFAAAQVVVNTPVLVLALEEPGPAPVEPELVVVVAAGP